MRHEPRPARSGFATGSSGIAEAVGMACRPHTGDIGLSRATDRQIVEYAREEGLIVVTLDADFHAIIAVENASSPSVVRIRREGMKAHALTSLLIEVWPAVSDQLQSGALVTIDDRSVRVRSIPIHRTP